MTLMLNLGGSRSEVNDNLYNVFESELNIVVITTAHNEYVDSEYL